MITVVLVISAVIVVIRRVKINVKLVQILKIFLTEYLKKVSANAQNNIIKQRNIDVKDAISLV